MLILDFDETSFFYFELEVKHDLTWEQCDRLNDEQPCLLLLYLPTDKNTWLSVRDETGQLYFSIPVRDENYDLYGKKVVFDIIVTDQGEEWVTRQNLREQRIRHIIGREFHRVYVDRVYIAGPKRLSVYCEERLPEPPCTNN